MTNESLWHLAIGCVLSCSIGIDTKALLSLEERTNLASYCLYVLASLGDEKAKDIITDVIVKRLEKITGCKVTEQKSQLYSINIVEQKPLSSIKNLVFYTNYDYCS